MLQGSISFETAVRLEMLGEAGRTDGDAAAPDRNSGSFAFDTVAINEPRLPLTDDFRLCAGTGLPPALLSSPLLSPATLTRLIIAFITACDARI